MLEFFKFYTRPQTYRVRIEVKVKNIGRQTNKCTVVIPLPLSAEYQKIIRAFSERKMLTELELGPGREETISVPFTAYVVPRKIDEAMIINTIRQANEFVIGCLQYGNAIEGLYTAQQAREKRIVDCGGFNTLLQDELKKKGIESSVVAGFWNTGAMHAWLEIEGGIPADPSVEHLKRLGRTKKSGRLGFVGSDRIAISSGGEFLQNPFLSGETAQLHYEHHFYCTRA